MRWWFKARETHTVLPVGFALFLAMALFAQDHTVLLPSLMGGGSPVVAMLFAPLALCGALMRCFEARLTGYEETSVRPLRIADGALTLAVVAAASVAGLVIGRGLGSDAALTVGRNTAFLVGMMLCVRAVAGQAAVLAPTAWVFVVIFLGFESNQHAYAWSVIPRDSGDPYALAGAALALASGLALQLTRTPSPRTGNRTRPGLGIGTSTGTGTHT